MTPSPLFSGSGRALRCLALGMATLLGALCVSGAASAATKYDAKALERGMKEAPAVVAAAKLPCEVKEAAYVGTAKTKEGDKETTSSIYEVACSSGQGFMITRLQSGQPGLIFNCNQAETYNKAKKEIGTCQLPGNAVNYTWLTPIVQKAVPSCVVNKARWQGELPASKTARYEIGCASGTGGGIYDIPNYDNTDAAAKATYHSCLQVLGSNSECQYVTKEEAIKAISPQITKASASCQVNNIRYAGASDENNYYEVGCANQAGFILVTTKADQYASTAGCDRAASIGGCKFTDTATIAAGQNAEYQAKLTKVNAACTVKEYLLIGTVAAGTPGARDLVEFNCNEKPWGYMTFMPVGASAKFEGFDCFEVNGRRIQGGRIKCTYVSDDLLLKQIGVMAKASTEVKKDCVVNQVRYAGMTDENDVVIEIACVNKRGYLAAINKQRTSLVAALPCTVAKKYTQKCEIPGNGTFVLEN